MIKKHSSKFFKLLSIFLFVALVPALGFCEEAGKIIRAEGRVDILRSGKDRAEPINEGEKVYAGDIIRTKSDGRVEITFIDNSVMKVGPRSRLGIEEYLYKPDETRKASLKLYRGIAGFHVKKAVFSGNGSKFEMKTRTAVAGVRGTEGILYTNGAEGVYVKEGLVRFSNPLGAVMVGPGKAAEILYGKPPAERPFLRDEYIRYEERINPRLTADIGERHKAADSEDKRIRDHSSFIPGERTEDRFERHITGPEDVRYEQIERPESISSPVNEIFESPIRDTHTEPSQPNQALPITDVEGHN